MAIIAVCATPVSDCAALDAAVLAAQPGDVLELATGDYLVANLILAKDLTLRAGDEASVALFAPEGHGLTVTDGADVTVKGLTVASGADFGTAFVVEGGSSLTLLEVVVPPREVDFGTTALFVTGASTVTVEGLTIVGHTVQGTSGSDGIIIVEEGSTASFRRLALTDNAANYYGALWIRTGASALVADSVFERNSSRKGGAVFAQELSTLLVETSTFTDNFTIEEGGGAIAAHFATSIEVVDSHFEGNDALQGGAILISSYETPFRVAGSTFVGNHAVTRGGALCSTGAGSFAVEDCLFIGNTSDLYGGAIDLDSTYGTSISGSGFCENRATSLAGAITVYGATPVEGEVMIHHDWFVENSAAYQIGAVRVGLLPAQLDHVALLGNAAEDLGDPQPIGGAGFYDDSPIDVTSSIVAWHAGTALYAGHVGQIAGNLFHQNGVDLRTSEGAAELPADNVVEDPGIVGYTEAGVPNDGVAACDAASMRLQQGSAARGAGLGENPDGTPADAGPFGGNDAPPWAWKDDDLDGVPWAHDCDDHEPGDHDFPCVQDDWVPDDTGREDTADSDPIDTEPQDDPTYWFTGGGCTNAPAAPLIGLAGLALGITRRRSSRR